MSSFTEDGYLDIEMTINSVEEEYRIYFDYQYEPAQTSRYSGTSHQENEEFPESHGFCNLQYETINGCLVNLSGKGEDYALAVLHEIIKGK